jgi:hypothetical protein
MERKKESKAWLEGRGADIPLTCRPSHCILPVGLGHPRIVPILQIGICFRSNSANRHLFSYQACFFVGLRHSRFSCFENSMLLRQISSFLTLAISLGLVRSLAVVSPRGAALNTALWAADSWNGAGSSSSSSGRIEQLEFKIYPDGRIEETVRGIKGNNCHKVTEKINEKLGIVVATTPTEEMFEQQVTVSETISLKDSSGWEGSSTW